MENENGSTQIQSKAKMSGYLEKKSKMRMVSSWKKYWFVLQDRLLLFYRSKDEYEAISACKGSINLGPPCTIKSYPSVQHAFQIVTRATSFTLRAENAVDQKKWMQTIMYALNQDNSQSPNQTKQSPSSTAAHHQRLNHFRYSLDDLVPEVEPPKKFDRASSDLITRIQKMGGISYGGSLGTITNQLGPRVTSLENKKRSKDNIPDNVTVRKNKSLSNENFSSISRIENLYERISSDSSNDGGGVRSATTSLYERIPYESIQSNTCERVQSLIIDNENYSVPMKKTQSLSDRKNNNTDSSLSFTIENAIYGQGEGEKRGFEQEEAIYAEPHVKQIDHNENDLLVENTIYSSSSPNNRNNTEQRQHENLYECVDEDLYCTPAEVIQKKSKKCKKKNPEKEKPVKIKKSKSFMKRLLSKKTESKKNKQQNSSEQDDRSDESAIYDEIDPKGLEKFALNDTNAVQMLTELASLLEAKKPTLIKSLSDPSGPLPTSAKLRQRSESSDKLTASPPLLPLKLSKQKQNNNDISPSGTVYSKWASDTEQPRSLDEILEDLDRDSLNPQPEPKNKIKRLIEKFDGDNNVVLRKHRNAGRNFSRYSDELDYLLEELAKITSAPIMAPGATNSLIDPTLHDEQWLKLIPKRQRRLSEPDYDVPRPLKFEKTPEKAKTEEKKDESLNISMTPDSLEIDAPKIIIKEYCYDSHFQNECNKGLAQDLKCFSQRYKNEDNNNSIYAVPKSYVSVATHIVNTCQNICSSELMAEEHTIIYKTVKNIITESEEVFADSLELDESLTKF